MVMQGGMQNGLGSLFGMLGQPLLQQFMPPGFELGPFGGNQNMQDYRSNAAFSSGVMGAAMDLGGAAGAQGFNELMTGTSGQGGVANLPGVDPASMPQMQGADVGKFMGQMMPFASVMMGGSALFDALGMGSFTAASHHGELFRSHMETPGQGNGLTSAQVRDWTTQVSGGIRQRLYGPDGNDLKATHGIKEGFGAGLLNAASKMGISGVNTGEFIARDDKRGMIDAGAASQMKLSRGAAAVRDLGGPFSAMDPEQMLGQLDKFTMGRLSKGQDAEELGDQVRMFKELATQSGLEGNNYGDAAALQQIAGARSAELGGSQSFGTVGGEHAMAFGAYAKGRGDLVKSAGVSANELMQQDAYLTAQAASSSMGNEAAALMRMGEAGMLKGDAQAAFEKLRDKGELDPMSSDEFRGMLKKSGVNMGAAGEILNQREANRKMHGDAVAGAVRNNQWEADIAPTMQRNVANALGRASEGRMTGKQAMEAGDMVTETLKGMAGKSRDEMREALVDKFKAMGANEQDSKTAAEAALGAADTTAIKKGFKGGVGHVVALNSDEAEQGVKDQMAAAKKNADAAKEVADQQQNAVERGIDEVKRDDATLGTVAAAVAGGRRVGPAGDEETGGGVATAANAEAATRATAEAEAREAAQDGGDNVQRVEVVNTPSVAIAGDQDVPAGPRDGASAQPLDAGGVGL